MNDFDGQKLNAPAWWAVVLCLIAPSFAACTGGNALVARADYVSGHLQRIHEAAYACAERELALAETNYYFGVYEMERGNFLEADAHLETAVANIDAAIAIVDARPECWPDYVADTDGDGIFDDVDECIYDPEDFDNFEDEDGCPDLDNDLDEIVDVDDDCPNDPEDYDLFEDEDGCPDPDNDADGIVDVDDDCPNEPEDFDGDQDEDGCPEESYEYVTLTDTQIEISQQIQFAYDSSRILEESYGILDEVAMILQSYSTVTIRIEGHTDSDGSERYNQSLSDDRASSVRAYLIQAGINPARMTSIGYGEEFPIESNTTPEGRALNRRVEFHIVSR